MAYRWKIKDRDTNTFKPCHIWSWEEKSNCKEISNCQGLSGKEEETCWITADARIFMKSDKCNKITDYLHIIVHKK